MSRLTLALSLVGLGAVWGLTLPLTKIAVSTGHQPLGLIFWQLAYSVIALSVIALFRRVRPRINRRVLIYFLIIGLLGTVLPNNASYLAITRLPAGVMAIIIASVPMFTLVIANGLHIERFSMVRFVGVIIGAVAVAVLILPETSLPEPGMRWFILIGLLAPLFYAMEGNYIAVRAPRGIDAATALLGASIFGALIVGPVAGLTGSWVNLFTPWGAPEWALLASSLCHVAAYTGYIWLVGASGPIFSSQISYVVTLSGVFLSALILSESYSPWVWLALILMIAGLALVQPREAESTVIAKT